MVEKLLIDDLSTSLPRLPFFTCIFILTARAAEHQLCHTVTGGRGGLPACTLYRCPLQKVMVWDNYPSTSTCLLKMADSAVVGFQYETVVIRIWISFHSHSGSHPDNTWLTKSARWNWPVSSISRAICATQPWITAMGKTYCHTAGWEEPKIPRRTPRIGTARRNESTITHFH